MKINRLTEIVLTLLNKKTVTAKELSDKFNVSTRTIYRDIETLSSSGVPVYMNKGKGGGISLLEGYSVNKTMLSEDDKQSLQIALKTLSSLDYIEASSLINKFGIDHNENDKDDFIEIDFSRWGSLSKYDDGFNEIKKAILDNKIIEFRYVSSYTNESSRIVEPMKLIYKGQTWYLQGYCRTKDDIRIFRINRIKDLSVMDEEFKRRDIELRPIDDMTTLFNNVVNLKMKVKREALYRLFDDVDKDSIIDNNDGTYDVNMELPENDWLYGYILSFGNHIEIIEPKHIREIIVEKIKDAIKIYDNR